MADVNEPVRPEGASEVVEVELAAGLGLAEALTIGIGTMIGAGIFVLPGIIVAKTGPAAVLSFLLGGVIALFSAMSVAEIATGMPKSGGGYYFISRALGPLWGAIIGWGSWFALIFASAFYMVGFGEYVATFINGPVRVFAIVMTAVLVVLNLVGSRAAGQAQNIVVFLLGGVIALFIGKAAMSADPSLIAGDFAPFGLGAIFGGTATLFVTYCGFAGIASVAEEIREPGKNLPRSILGSVILVTILYGIVMLLCVMVRPYQQLQGPTVVADLGEDLLGSVGRGVITVGALLATISSANASIMSASRISFAMGRDRLIWDWLNEIHPRFRVPHKTIIATGVVTLGVIMLRKVDLLAEASGFLHLVLYGLISISCIVLRGARLPAYQPRYRVPLFPVIPIVAAVSSFAIAFLMAPVVLVLGLAIAGLALGHYFVYGRKQAELEGAWPYFLRRGVLEPAMRRVEQWGATPDELPTMMVAVGNPHRERARLELASAMMRETTGEILAVNVFTVGRMSDERADVVERYYRTTEERSRALRDAAAKLDYGDVRVTSHVPVSGSVFYGLVSAADASNADVVLLGWPEPDTEGAAGTSLMDALDGYLRAHVLVLREQGQIPPETMLAMVDDGPNGDLALRSAARLANAWGVELTVGGLTGADANAEQIAELEADLEMRVGDSVRARLQVIPADALAQAAEEAAFHEMLVVGVGSPRERPLSELISELDGVESASVLLVSASGDQPIDGWM